MKDCKYSLSHPAVGRSHNNKLLQSDPTQGMKQRALLFQIPSVPREFILDLVGHGKKNGYVKVQSYKYS